MVVDFTAKWCKPCKQIAPFFEELSNKYCAATFVTVDVDELEVRHCVRECQGWCGLAGRGRRARAHAPLAFADPPACSTCLRAPGTCQGQDVYAESGGKMLPTFQVYRGTKKVRESTGAIKDELEKMIAAECL